MSSASSCSKDAVMVGADNARDYDTENILPLLDADLVKIREWLQPTPFDQEKSEFSRHSASFLMGTGKWLTSSIVFQQWHSGENGLLWIKGIPGSGKSVMAASIIDQLRVEKVPVLFFFFRQIIDANHRPVAALRDWLSQLLSYSPSLQVELHKFVEGPWRRTLKTVSLDDLWRLLKVALSALPKAYCITDALDEMDPGNDKFLHALAEFGQWRPSNIKVLITSRPVATVESSLRGFSIPHVRLEEQLVDRDIAAYVQYRLQKSHIPQENWNVIEEAIPGRANGLFLYAKLSMDAFLEPGADTSEVLRNLPADLSVMYDDLLRNHAKRSGVPDNLQLLVLQAVTHATRPLRLLEITEMVNTVYDGLQFHGVCTPGKTKEWVGASCGTLLEILPDETISVVHHSLTEFLKGFTRTSEANESSYPIFRPGPTNQSLAVSCLKYLRHGCLDKHEVKKQSDFDNIWGGLDDDWEAMERAKAVKQAKADLRLRFPFLEYAANNWPEHARRASNAGADMTYFYAMLDVFFTETQRYNAWIDIAWPSFENVSPLHVAAYNGLTNYVAHLLEKGEINIETRDSARTTPIYWAASAGHADVVRLLLNKGAKPNVAAKNGLKPLHRAADRNHPEVIRLLLAAGVDPLSKTTQGYSGYSSGRLCGEGPLSRGHTPLMYACHNGHVEAVTEFLPFLSDEAIYWGLSWAAEGARSNIVDLILKRPGVDVNGKYRGDTALYKACQTGNQETMAVLLQAGADTNVFCENARKEFFGRPDRRQHDFKQILSEGFTALHAFCSGSKPTPEGMQLLLQAGANVQAKTPNGETALHLACKNTSAFPIIQSLLDAGADPTAEADDGSTPLHTDGRTDRESLPILLSNGTVDINKARSKDGNTPLHCRLAKNFQRLSDAALEFLAHKPDVNAANFKGDSILHYALARYEVKPDFIAALLSSGANPNARNRDGDTPLHSTSITKPEIYRLLLDAGADLEARDRQGQTPLFKNMLQINGRVDKAPFRTLIELGARMDACDFKGRTPFHYEFKVERVKELLKLGVNHNVIDHEGNTPLHASASIGSPIIKFNAIEMFVGLGHDIDRPNNQGRTALHILCSKIDCVSRNSSNHQAIDYAIRCSKNPSISDFDGNQPIHLAAAICEVCVYKLLNAGANLFGVTHEGMTVLHIAARACQHHIISLVLSRAWKFGRERLTEFVDQVNAQGKSALHYACSSGRPESVKALLEAGANPNSRDNSLMISPFMASIEFETEQALEKDDDNDYAEAVSLLINDKKRPRLS